MGHFKYVSTQLFHINWAYTVLPHSRNVNYSNFWFLQLTLTSYLLRIYNTRQDKPLLVPQGENLLINIMLNNIMFAVQIKKQILLKCWKYVLVWFFVSRSHDENDVLKNSKLWAIAMTLSHIRQLYLFPCKHMIPKYFFLNYTTILCLMQQYLLNITTITHKTSINATILSYALDVSVKPTKWAEDFLSDTHVSSLLTHPFHHS